MGTGFFFFLTISHARWRDEGVSSQGTAKVVQTCCPGAAETRPHRVGKMPLIAYSTLLLAPLVVAL